MDRKIDNLLLVLMGISFIFAVGSFINGIFMIIYNGFKDPMSIRIFIIAACFFLAGKIFLSVIERRRDSRGVK